MTETRWKPRLADETSTETETEPATEPETAAPVQRAGVTPLANGLLCVLGLAWLAATLWTAHASIVGNATDAAVALGSAAAALPGVIAAALLAGGCVALAAGARLTPESSPRLRLGLGLIGGAGVGILAGGLILYGYGANARVSVLATTVAVAALIGGAGAALPRPVFAAGLVATLTVFGTGVFFNVLQGRLTTLYGGGLGASLQSQADASRAFAYTQSAVSGIVAGVCAYLYLRRQGDRPWPWYLLAGALPGLLLLVTEALTNTGGASLLGLVKDLSEGDRALVEFTDFARLRNAMIVFFAGGIAAMIAVGRTLRPASSSEEDRDSVSPDSSDDEASVE